MLRNLAVLLEAINMGVFSCFIKDEQVELLNLLNEGLQ